MKVTIRKKKPTPNACVACYQGGSLRRVLPDGPVTVSVFTRACMRLSQAWSAACRAWRLIP